MKETPLLLCGEMVRATLEDRKTQTRRVGSCQHDTATELGRSSIRHATKGTVYQATYRAYPDGGSARWALCECPYGIIGDQLYFKETHYRWGRWRKDGLTKTGRQRWRFKAVPWTGESNGIRFCVNETRAFEPAKKRNKLGWHKRPSIFMPRLGARLRATITDVRVERVSEISARDCISEGIDFEKHKCGCEFCAHTSEICPATSSSLIMEYQKLWDSLNAKRGFGWDKNPWVWAISFRRITP